jgi:hypothetical protein
MQGKCASPAPSRLPSKVPSTSPAGHIPLLPKLHNQCLLFVNEQLLRVEYSKLWLDSLYVRLTAPRTPGGKFPQLIHIAGQEAEVWMTGVTLQGNSDGVQDCNDCGLNVDDHAQVYAKGEASACNHTCSAGLHCCRSRCLRQTACMLMWVRVLQPT